MRITRRRALFLFGIVALLPLPSLKAAAQNADSGEFALTILHTNDLHGHIFPFAYIEEGRSKAETPSVGGAAHLDTNKTYKVAFVDYPAQAAYELPEAKLEATGRDLRDVVMAHLNRKTSVLGGD